MAPIAKLMLGIIGVGCAIWLIVGIVFVVGLFVSAIAIPTPPH